MFRINSITIEKGRVRKNEAGAALATAATNLDAPGLLSNTSGAGFYLPAYRSAAQQAAGREAFATTLQPDGTLTIYLESLAAEALPAASPLVDGATFALLTDASGGGARLPLQAARQGNIVELKAKLAGEELRRLQAALFDTAPNVAVEVTQPVRIAARMTDDFVQRNWDNDTIRAGLLGLFGGIPYDSPNTYSRMAASGDPDFPNQFLLLACTYKATIGVPPLPGYIQWQLDWNGRAYNYYQDNREPSRIFYLPDRFEFAKGQSGAPTISLLQFSVPQGASSETETRAAFRYFGRPVVDAARIQNASDQLRAKTGAAVQLLNIEDGHAVSKTFAQYLPNAQASSESGTVQAQPEASIDLAKGLRNELDLNLLQFRALWGAIFSAAPEKTLFRGWVDVELSGGRYQERIEFNGRISSETPAAFLDDILDIGSTRTYPAKFTFSTFPKFFEEPMALLEIGLSFSGNQQLTLSAEKTKDTISLERPIRDIILGNQAPDQTPYQLHVVRSDGTIRCGSFMAASGNRLPWITLDMINSCGDCAPSQL